jgi:plasmid stability protein
MAKQRERAASASQRSAGQKNLAKGRKAKEEQMERAREQGAPKAGERWAMLLSGQLTVRDLDDEEIRKMRVRGADGGFGGKRRAVPSNLIQAFQAESIRRSNDKLRTAAPEAVQALIDIGKDPSVREGDRIRALQYVVDRALGKTPETVHVKNDDPWSNLGAEAFVEDRDLDDLTAEAERLFDDVGGETG